MKTFNSVVMFLYVKLGFGKLNASEKVSKALSIVAALTGNANYPNTIPPLTEVEAAANDLQIAIEEAETGEYEKVEIRNQKEIVLDVKMATLQSDINTKSGGDSAKILGAGFEVSNPRLPIGILGPVVGLVAIATTQPGVIRVKWPRMNKTRIYNLERATTAVGPFEEICECTKSSYTDEGLVSGQMYYYRVACVTAAGTGPFSEVVTCKAY